MVLVPGHNAYSRHPQGADRFLPASDTTGFVDSEPRRTPPLPVARALREACHIDYDTFFLAVGLKNGKFVYFSGPNSLPEREIPDMFREEKFLECQKGVSTGMGTVQRGFGYLGDEFNPDEDGMGQDHRGQRHPMMDQLGAPRPQIPRRRKRQKRSTLRREIDDEPAPIITSKKGIRIGDSQALWNFYDHRFKCAQQMACRMLGKVFVKAVAPKKQSNHPYTKGDATAPDWWPKPWGPGPKERVQHKEPDHLYKLERVFLLCHILRMVIEPQEKQHPDIQRLGLNVAKLEEASMDALDSWFSSPDNPNNAKKKPFLKELFKVARMEEKYKKGEIDANTVIYVAADAMMPNIAELDMEEDELEEYRESEDISRSGPPSRSSSAKAPTPANMIPPISVPHSPAGNLQNPSFISDIPIRGSYGSGMMSAELTGEQSYGDGSNMVGNTAPQSAHTAMPMSDMMPAAHEAARRPSLFPSPTEFSPHSAQSLYSGSWPQASAASGTPSVYTYTPHVQPSTQSPGSFTAHHQHTAQTPTHMGQGSQYMGGSFDAMRHASAGGTTNSPTLYRSNSAGHASVPSPQGFSGYLPHGSRGQQGQ